MTEYGEREILDAIVRLRHAGFAAEISGGGRALKYAQRFTEKLNMGRRETALLCVLLLRGHQTLGELKARTERMYAFADLDEIEMVLQKLGEYVRRLPPAPGMKEPRFAHLLGGPVEQVIAPERAVPSDRIIELENQVSQLREEVAELRRLLEQVL